MNNVVVFVPGLGESAMEIYQDVAEELRERLKEQGSEPKESDAALDHTLLIAASTHPEQESIRQTENCKRSSRG